MIAINAIISLLLLLLLGLFFYGPWQAICTDYARQVIFEKRDAIFDIADRGELSFAGREYRTIRSGLENLIRFAHELTLPNLIFLWIFIKPRGQNEKPAIQRAIDHIQDEKVKCEVERLVDGAMLATTAMIVLKSPLTMLLAVAFMPFVIIVSGLRQCAKTLLGRSKILIQFEAERVGTLEDATAI